MLVAAPVPCRCPRLSSNVSPHRQRSACAGMQYQTTSYPPLCLGTEEQAGSPCWHVAYQAERMLLRAAGQLSTSREPRQRQVQRPAPNSWRQPPPRPARMLCSACGLPEATRAETSASLPQRQAEQENARCPLAPGSTVALQGIAHECGLTLRSSGRPPAGRLGRAAGSGIILCAAKAPYRRSPLSSNVRRRMHRWLSTLAPVTQIAFPRQPQGLALLLALALAALVASPATRAQQAAASGPPSAASQAGTSAQNKVQAAASGAARVVNAAASGLEAGVNVAASGIQRGVAAASSAVEAVTKKVGIPSGASTPSSE